MAITNFIPTIWSETLSENLRKQHIAVAHSNRDFEGDIKEKGSVVRICGVGNIAVGDYTKNTDMTNPQSLSDTVTDLEIDQAKYFNFQIDDIDRAQCSPKLMDAAMKGAAYALANEADKYIFSLHNEAGNSVDIEYATADNIIDAFLEARTKLYDNNVYDTNDVVIEISPEVAEMILKAKINLATDNSEALENGCIGSIGGCKIFVSRNIEVEDSGDSSVYKCFVRTKRAIAFAEQISEINAYRPEKRFADAVKGLYLYGAKVVYPGEFVVVNVGIQSNN